MKKARPTDQIDVQALRVGMFVHLDIGWMSHPFPLSSFRITTAAQLATIRSLGLRTVRWSPQQSDLAAGRRGARADDAARAAAGRRRRRQRLRPRRVRARRRRRRRHRAVRAAGRRQRRRRRRPRGAARASAERARKLARQREAEERCARQYGEAARACRQTLDLVPGKPQEARAQAEALSRSIVDKMVGEQDLCIRMLAEGAGDKASMHAMNVGIISLLMGRCFGFDDEEMQDLGVGAMLHDIGKIEMPVRLRHREDNFSPNEVRAYEEHVEMGLAQARRMGLSRRGDGGDRPAPRARRRQRLPGQAQQRPDDDGGAHRRPRQPLRQPLQPAPAGRALTPHESLSLLFAQGRSKFDTSILGAFIKMMGVYPPGSTVQLTDDRYALVVAVNSARPLKPNVHRPRRRRCRAPRRSCSTSRRPPASASGAASRAQQLPPTALDYLAPAPRVTYFFEPSAPIERRMNNPLPVDPFSVAEAARRTWPALIEAMLEAVCLVEPEGLRIVAANGAAGRLLGLPPAELVGRDMLATAPTPEDESFWQRVGEKGALRPASSPTRSSPAPAARRCRSCAGSAGSSRRRATRSTSSPWSTAASRSGSRTRVAVGTAELAATLESVADGVLVVDLAGHISHFNRRFAALWELPDEMLLLHADDEVFDWMRQRVADPAAYMRRLAEIDERDDAARHRHAARCAPAPCSSG